MQSLQHILETEFARGMNNKDKPEYVKKGQVVKALNCLVGDQKIKKGPGTTLLFNMVTDKVILGGISTNSEIYIVANEPNDTLAFIYRYTGSGEPVVVSGANLTASTQVNFVDTGNAVYVLNGVDAVGKLVGATYTTPAGIPIGKYGAWLNNRFYVAGVTGNLNTLYYSDANDPDTFGGSSNIKISASLRSNITGLNTVGGVLAIGKTDNVATFNGFTEDSFAIKDITNNLPNFGSVSHRAMVNIGDDLIFLSYSGGVPHFRSLGLTNQGVLNDGGVVSKDFEATMMTINEAQIGIACGGFDGRYAYWSVPTGSSLVNDTTLIYDTFEKGWTIHDSMPATVYFRSQIVSSTERLYFGSSASASKVLYVNLDASARDSSAISMEVISRVYRPQSSRKSKNKYLYLTTGDETEGDIAVLASPDGYTYESQGTMEAPDGQNEFPFTFPFTFGATFDNKKRINLSTGQSYTYQLKFTESSTSPVTIKEWDLYYYTRKLRDK